MAKKSGWVPNQHGAWAMLTVPFWMGLVLAARDGALGWWQATLFAFWMLGYFAFHAASGWLKAAARRRPEFVKPAVTYALASAVFGVATLVLGGTSMAWWVVAFLPLVIPALWLAAQRHERATLGGALTTAAASLMLLVVRYPDPRGLWVVDAAGAWVAMLLALAYFFGTVLYVKTNIRERGNAPFLRTSVGYHAVWTAMALALAEGGLAAWWWTPFFGLATVRAGLVPGRGWTPKQVGFLEVAFSASLVVLFAVWPR